MTSMKVPDGLMVTVYEHCFDGRYETFYGPIESSHIPNFWSDIVSSLRVSKISEDTSGVTLYEHDDFHGR